MAISNPPEADRLLVLPTSENPRGFSTCPAGRLAKLSTKPRNYS